jgi:organic radical activating enzyme
VKKFAKNVFINCCDGIYKSLEIHWCSECTNNCSFCIDKTGTPFRRYNYSKIKQRAFELLDTRDLDDVLILGGEPLLHLDDVIDFCKEFKIRHPYKKIYITTSLPKICYDQVDKFTHLLTLVSGLNISVLHYDQSKAARLFGANLGYNRHFFICSSITDWHKSKITLCANLTKGKFDSREDIEGFVNVYSLFGYRQFKIRELQNADNEYVSFDSVMGAKRKDPYIFGCSQNIYYDNRSWQKHYTPGASIVTIRRSCWNACSAYKKTKMDSCKEALKKLFKKDFNSLVLYENGSVYNGWTDI